MATYSTIIWDCDGVIINSNHIKTAAFGSVTQCFGEKASSAMVNFHTQNGGVSRYVKFEHFVDSILPAHAPDVIIRDRLEFLDSLLTRFAAEIKARLLLCEVAAGLMELRQAMPNTRWLVVSGSDQTELREVFKQRDLAQYFDGGIYGSPKDKHTIVTDLLNAREIQSPVLFLGDSPLDHQVARDFNFDFIFLNNWTEFIGWRQYCHKNGILCLPAISDILKFEMSTGFE